MTLQIEVNTKEELEQLKQKATKLKVILMERKGKHPLQNISLLNKRDKDLFEKELEELWNTMSDEEITNEFNSICCDRIFTEGTDVSNYRASQLGEVPEDIAEINERTKKLEEEIKQSLTL